MSAVLLSLSLAACGTQPKSTPAQTAVIPLDTVTVSDNDLVTSGKRSIQPGQAGTVSVYLVATSEAGDARNCNATPGQSVRVALTTTDPRIEKDSTGIAGYTTLTDCGQSAAGSIRYSASTSATPSTDDSDVARMTLVASGGKQGSTYTYPLASFTVQFTPAPPPQAPRDSSGPEITSEIIGTLGLNNWYTSDVTVRWNVTDDGSAISSMTGCDASTAQEDTSGLTLTCSATSAGGTTSRSVTFKRDATAPTISAAPSRAPNQHGWYNDDVNVNFTCNDSQPGSGLAAGACPSAHTQSEETGQNGQNISKSVTDQAGNSATSDPANIKLDKTAPRLNPSVTPNPVLLGGTANASAGASDPLSGLASQACDAVVTSRVGAQQVTCRAADLAGNTAQGNAAYSVIYEFQGFFSPVDNGGTLNRAKAGSAVPVKFSLKGDQGLSILASGSPTAKVINCSSTASTDDVEVTSTAGSSSLSFDSVAGHYVYVWKTDKAWAGQCRQLVVKLADDTVHTANFTFVR
ncbi:PxKF domain-containing protein [Deinococcus peraridilitoris]|uniref:PxKF domain-containing protein n=1 Tax=Deinococcus peraridilitoris TaxID=432329 RepID=UPI00059C62AB|nr:PxKF domain-containing protein [Deinococcus peraridilitoris]